MLDLAEVEKAEIRTSKEIQVPTLGGIDEDLVSRSAPSTGDDEKLVVDLKPFVRVIVPAEKEARLLESHKRIGKVFLNSLIWGYGSAVGKGGFVTADNYKFDVFVLVASFELTPIPLGLLLDLFRGQDGEVGIEQDDGDVLPVKAVPTPFGKMGKAHKIIMKGSFIIAVQFMIS